MGSSQDYRLTSLSAPFSILDKKSKLLARIEKAHPHAKGHYRYVQKDYKEEMARVYENRCCYCGIRVGLLPLYSFEIDHIICKDIASLQGINGHHLDNLAFSCHVCNSRKKDYPITEESILLLSPDQNLGMVLLRDGLYRLTISGNHANNENVVQFYKRLNLGSELRRLDHLLVELDDLIENLSNMLLPDCQKATVAEKLKLIEHTLLKYRNSTCYSLVNWF